jgi:uncharacterized membrane protein
MGMLLLAGLLFVVTHLGISSTGLRGWLVSRVGPRAYLGLYSLIAAATLGFLIIAYRGAPPAEFLWVPSQGLRWTALLLMPVAMVFMLGGFFAPNPTGVGMEGKITSVGDGVGMTRITRHPLQWSFVLWAVAHILANGDLRSLVLFVSIGTVSLLGSVLMDRKKAATLGDDWTRYASATSNLPFAAIATGRNRLVASELAVPVLVGLVGYGLALWGHAWLSGVPLF